MWASFRKEMTENAMIWIFLQQEKPMGSLESE
jgi:hypothetical protein